MQIHTVEDGKEILTVRVPTGTDTPYYYSADGVTEAYIRIGNESVLADPTELKRLVLRGNNSSYDALVSPYDYEDFSFSKLRERYKSWTGNSMTEKLMDSFGIRDTGGKLTNAGALLADDCPSAIRGFFVHAGMVLTRAEDKLMQLTAASFRAA